MLVTHLPNLLRLRNPIDRVDSNGGRGQIRNVSNTRICSGSLQRPSHVHDVRRMRQPVLAHAFTPAAPTTPAGSRVPAAAISTSATVSPSAFTSRTRCRVPSATNATGLQRMRVARNWNHLRFPASPATSVGGGGVYYPMQPPPNPVVPYLPYHYFNHPKDSAASSFLHLKTNAAVFATSLALRGILYMLHF